MAIRNPLIIEQSRKTGVFDQVSVARRQVETIACTTTVIEPDNTGTAANPQKDVMVEPAETT